MERVAGILRRGGNTKHFLAGILVVDPLPLPVHKDKVRGLWIPSSSNGITGGSKRVNKCFPVVDSWKGQVTYHVLDSVITRPVFEHTLTEAGRFTGILTFRPQRGGWFGRYKIVDLKWQEN